MAGWGHALAAAVGGWQQGKSMVEAAQDRKDEKEWRDEQRANARKDRAEQDSLKSDLKDASRTVAVDEGANGMIKPVTMDNRDVGLPENAALPNQGLQEGGFGVKGQSFTDKPAADAAAAKMNNPDAVNDRIAGAYRSHGDVDKAMAYENGARTAKLGKMELADKEFQTGLGNAMRGGHAGLAQFGSSYEGGAVSGQQFKAIPSEDGKTVTYATAGKDGVFAPIPGLPQFSNDQNGVIQAAYTLDRTIGPKDRMAHSDMMAQRKQAQDNTDRTFSQQEDHFTKSFGLQQGVYDRQNRVVDQQLEKGALELKDMQRSAKIPPAVKMQVESLKKESEGIATAMNKALADGSWDANSAGAKQLMERQAIVNAQITKHLTPFMKDESNGVLADPMGIRKPQGRNAGANGGMGGGAGRGLAPISYKDPVWDSAESNASKKTGVPTEVLRTIRTVGERSNGDQVSPAGAKGVYQFIPSTRDKFKQKYGVDAYSDDHDEQAMAAAYHLKEAYDRTGSWDKAMAGYNGGTSAEKGTNNTAENRSYASRTSAALAAADPMDALYKKQVNEMNKGLRTDLSPDVSAWRKRKDDNSAKEGQQRFNASQAAYMQSEKLKAQRDSKTAAASARS